MTQNLDPDYHNQIWCGNCVDLLKKVQSETVDLIVTSPPYDDLRQYEGYDFDFPSIAPQLLRILKPGGIVVWVVADGTVNGSETGTSFRQALYFMDIGFRLHDTMIYKRNAVKMPDKKRYFNCFQYMFVFSKGSPKTVNLIKDHKNKTAGKKANKRYQREADGKMKERAPYCRPTHSVRWNIWTYDVGSLIMADDRLWVNHPAIFPLKLAEDHIRSWSNEGDLVLDPMCGSGQTLIAAKKLKRNYLGIDISDKYCNLSEERLKLYNMSNNS